MLMILLAMLGGVLTTLSMIVSSALGKKIGLIQSTIIHYIGGLIGGVFILSTSAPSIIELSKMPLYIFLGGIMGVIVVYISNIVIPKIPVVYSTLLMFSGQMICAIIIDTIIIGEFSLKKLLGAIIVVLGIFYNSKIDEKENKIAVQ